MFGLFLLGLVAGSPAAMALSSGDSFQAVRDDLGLPNGSLEIGQIAVFFYDRGEIVLQDGLVTEINLLTEAEYGTKRKREAQRAILLQRIATERRVRNEAEGIALKQSKVDSLGFHSLPASERVVFWRLFKLKYPTVTVDLELTAAMTQSRIDQATAEKAAQDLYWKQARSTRVAGSSSYGWFPFFGIGSGYRPGHPVHPEHPIHPGRPPDSNDSGKNYHSTKGAIMAEPDRARGRIDRSYSSTRSSIYSSISP